MKETKKISYLDNNAALFGWKVVNTRHYRSGRSRHTEYTLERDLNINSSQLETLNNLEKRYKFLQVTSRHLPEVDGLTAFALFLLLVFPCIIYLCVKHKQKEKALVKQEAARKEMREIEEHVRRLIGRS